MYAVLAITWYLFFGARLWYPGLFATGDHAKLLLHVRERGAESAFSEEACEREFDAVWRVKQERAAQSANREFVSVAYFVQVGNDSVALLPRLFARIHHPRNVYVVHVDKKVPEELRKGVDRIIEESEEYRKNMYLLESEMVTYKAISMVMNTLAGMTLALEKHKGWHYFINLSGADYPLVSPENQARLLARPRVPVGRLNFVTFFPRKEWGPYSFRVRNMHWDPAALGYQSPKNQLRLVKGHKENPMEQHRAYTFTKAEAWMILSRPFIEFLVRSPFAKRMLINHAHVLSVAEHYFADILFNHPFWKTTIVPDALRKVVWYLKNRRSGQHPYYLDEGLSPFARWEYIAETRSLFARKFGKTDSPIMKRIDTEMSGAGLNTSNDSFLEHSVERKIFYDRIVAHFDDITKKTLALQGYKYPKTAYPET